VLYNSQIINIDISRKKNKKRKPRDKTNNTEGGRKHRNAKQKKEPITKKKRDREIKRE
jgi:hypothetical protein